MCELVLLYISTSFSVQGQAPVLGPWHMVWYRATSSQFWALGYVQVKDAVYWSFHAVVLVATDVSDCLAIPSVAGSVQVFGIMSNSSCFLQGKKAWIIFSRWSTLILDKKWFKWLNLVGRDQNKLKKSSQSRKYKYFAFSFSFSN